MPAPRLVLALGAACAMLLLSAAVLDLGDPRAAARGRMVDAAEAAGARVKSRWEALRRGSPPPAARTQGPSEGPSEGLPEGLSALRPPGTSTVRTLTAEPTGPSGAEDAVFDVLLEAAIASAAARDFGAALAGAEAALAERPQAGGAAKAHFHAARWWSALGSEAETERHRRLLLELPSASEHGTSLALLACLLPPVDAEAAESVLRRPEGALPRPKDRAVDDGTRLRFMPDPWWASIEKRLRDTEPSRDWDGAFQTEARIGDALAAAFPGMRPDEEELWSLAQVGRRHLAARSSGEGVRYAEIQEEALLDALHADVDPAAAGSQRVGLTLELGPRAGLSAGQPADARPGANGVRVYGPEPLAGTHLTFTLNHPDPEASALPELTRQRLLRVALVTLSGLILLGAIVASVTMTRAQRLAELRSTFVASVSHDLRTPTQAILLMAETLEQGRVKDDARRASYHVAIRKEAQRLRRQVEDLLDGARIDRGDGARVEREAVSTQSYFDGLGVAMAERAEAAGATLSITRGDLPTTLDIDPEGVHRAIWNLLENALLHGARDGAAPRVEISLEAVDDSLVVHVQDDGPGVPAEHRASIFEPFRQAKERGDIASDTGTGLGLAIVRALARAHGGDAELTPTDAGARFTVWFRFAAPPDEIPA